MQLAARVVLRLLTHTTARGTERLPHAGPYIIAGNHRAIMEVVLMEAFSPVPAEILGAGDLPLDRRYAWLGHLFGFIPYKRGSVDSKALRTAEQVLERGGVIGIFPEGGIWRSAQKEAHRGVAWLSYMSGAPVIPAGFGGVEAAIHRTVTLQRPRLEVNVGEPIWPKKDAPSKRQAIDELGERIIEGVNGLIPEWDRKIHTPPSFEQYSLRVEWLDQSGRVIRDEHLEDGCGEALAEFFHHPVLLQVFYKNLKRESAAGLRRLWRPKRPEQIVAACRTILGYVTHRNRRFFSYRLGAERAERLCEALLWLQRTAQQEAGNGTLIRLTPRYTWQNNGEAELHTRTIPPEPTPL